MKKKLYLDGTELEYGQLVSTSNMVNLLGLTNF
jgi:hypothetical protein